MSKYLTKSVAATISALLLLGCAAPAFAADAAVEKKETSYLILNADGSVQEQITSDWLHSDDGFDSVTDESGLSDIQNLKSDVMPEQVRQYAQVDDGRNRYLLSGQEQRTGAGRRFHRVYAGRQGGYGR